MDSFIEHTPFLTPEHRELAARANTFVKEEIGATPSEDRESHTRIRDYVRLLAEAGLLRYATADSDSRLDVRALCIVREALAYGSAIADLAFVMQGLGTYAISLAAPEHVRDFWVSRARAGKAVAAFAVTEAEAGSDIAAINTTARRDGDAYVIDGHKRFISNAGAADFYTVFARTSSRADGRAELSAFVVGAKMPGFSVTRQTTMLSEHPIGEIEFKGCRVPVENMVGSEGNGFLLAMRTLDTFRPTVGAAACGMARRALEEAVSHASTRSQFGRLLVDHQLIQQKLADMVTDLDAARLLVYQAAFLKDTVSGRVSREASEAKLFATEAACRIVDDAVQIHGASGLVRGSVVERLYRDIRALRIYEGTSEIQKLVIANQLTKNNQAS